MMMIYFFMLIMTTLVAMSSNSWMIIWMMLEINLMSFIPILLFKNKSKTTNFLFKFYLIQTISSSTLLISIMSMWLMNSIWPMSYMCEYISTSMMYLSMIMKMGLVPFHLWYIEFMMNITWMNFLLMSTWQKIIPLMIISYFKINHILTLSITLSALISSIQGMTQLNLRKIFTFSSINQTSWMTINSSMSLTMMMLYMTTYSLISFNIMYFFNMKNFSYIHQLFTMNNYSFMTKMFFMSSILSLAGLPPFLGFILKLMSIKFLIYNKLYLITTILMISSLMMLFFYMRLIYSSLILNFSKNKINMINMHMNNITTPKYLHQSNNYMHMLMMINMITLIMMLMLMMN
nr:NADH dehydrogenase subunit 2 [Syrista sp. 1 GYN-2021c]